MERSRGVVELLDLRALARRGRKRHDAEGGEVPDAPQPARQVAVEHERRIVSEIADGREFPRQDQARCRVHAGKPARSITSLAKQTIALIAPGIPDPPSERMTAQSHRLPVGHRVSWRSILSRPVWY